MAETGDTWKALSIRQPWVDMIVSGQKTIEIREWTYPPAHRGRFLIHVSQGLDWKTVALFGGRRRFRFPRGAFVAVADLYDVVEIDPARNWADLAREHRVVHPPNFGASVFGLRLRAIAPLKRSYKGRGEQYFFVPARDVIASVIDELGPP